MDTQDIAVFLDVYRNLSLKKVAELRRVSASTISRDLVRLEEELGVRLFERTTRRVIPTEEGVRFFGRVEPLLTELDCIRESFQGHARSEVTGKLRITSPVAFGLVSLTPLINEFQALFPAIEVDVILTDSQIDLIGERIDAAIRFGTLVDSNLVAKKLMDLNYRVCASSEYLARFRMISSPGELEKHECINYLLPGISDTWKFRTSKRAKPAEIPIKCRTRYSNPIAIKQATLSGAGISLLPDILIEDEIKEERLVTVLDDFEATPTSFDSRVSLVYPSKSYLPLRTRKLVEFLVGKLSRC